MQAIAMTAQAPWLRVTHLLPRGGPYHNIEWCGLTGYRLRADDNSTQGRSSISNRGEERALADRLYFASPTPG